MVEMVEMVGTVEMVEMVEIVEMAERVEMADLVELVLQISLQSIIMELVKWVSELFGIETRSLKDGLKYLGF